MKKIKAFFYVFFKSLTSFKYYNDVVTANLSLSIKYFLSLGFIFAVVSAVSVMVPLVPKVQGFVDTALVQVLDLYEDDLVITAENGEVSINKPEPYVIPLGGLLEDFDVDASTEAMDKAPKNLVVFDSAGTLDDLMTTYDTFVLINKSNVIYRDSEGIKVESLKEVPEGEIKKEDLERVVAKAEKFSEYIPYLMGALIFIGFAFYFLVVRFICSAFVAGGLWVVGRIKGLIYKYQTYFKIALHVVTVPLLIEVVSGFFQWTVPLPFWFFGVALIFGVLVLFNIDTAPVQPQEEPSA